MNAVAIHQSDSRAPWFKRWSTLIGVAALVAIICWAAGLPALLSQWADKQTQTKHAASNTAKPVIAAPTSAVGIIPPQPKGNDSSISKVPLPLLLTGTMPGRNAHEGQAFIGVNKDSPQTYAAGALLANGARIAEIYQDHVVLQRDGQSTNLYLQGSGHHANAQALSSLLTVGGTSPPKPAVATSHEILTDYIRPNPKYSGETLLGYEVYAGQNAGVFSQMGLQAGDVITSINGVPLNEPQSAIEQLRQLTQGIAVTATIERKGQAQTLSLDGASITKDQERAKNPVNNAGMNMPPM